MYYDEAGFVNNHKTLNEMNLFYHNFSLLHTLGPFNFLWYEKNFRKKESFTE